MESLPHPQREMKFLADNIRINGPKVDGTMSITFETGEYEREKILDIMKFKLPLIIDVNEQNPKISTDK